MLTPYNALVTLLAESRAYVFRIFVIIYFGDNYEDCYRNGLIQKHYPRH